MALLKPAKLDDMVGADGVGFHDRNIVALLKHVFVGVEFGVCILFVSTIEISWLY